MDEQLQNELEEQARLLGISAERECDLRGNLERERALAERRGRLYDTAVRRLKELQAQVDELKRERDDLKDQLATAMMSIRLQQRREQQTNEQP